MGLDNLTLCKLDLLFDRRDRLQMGEAIFTTRDYRGIFIDIGDFLASMFIDLYFACNRVFFRLWGRKELDIPSFGGNELRSFPSMD